MIVRSFLILLLLSTLPLTAIPVSGASVSTVFLPMLRYSLTYRIAYVHDVLGRADLLLASEDRAATIVLPTMDPYSLSPTWSPDGTRIAFISSQSSIVIMHVDGRQRTEFHPQPPPDTGLAWSPDGTRFAYIAKGKLYSITIADAQQQLLVSDVNHVCCPTWSPDSRRLAFAVYDLSYTDEIDVINADGTERKSLTQGLGGITYQTPAWSPNGEWIAFSADGKLAVMKSDGTNLQILPIALTGVIEPTWAPNSLRLAFATPYIGTRSSTIWITTLDGKELTAISDCCGNRNPAWAPR